MKQNNKDQAITPVGQTDLDLTTLSKRSKQEGNPHVALHEELKRLGRQLRQASSAKQRRGLHRKIMTVMLSAPQRCYWPGEPPHYRHDPRYIEAADIAWDYIERKLKGEVRGEAYDPDQGNASPITLWNIRCKGAYKDICKRESQRVRGFGDSQTLNCDLLPQPEAQIPDLEKVRDIMETDPTGELSRTWVCRTATAQVTVQEALLEIYDRASRGEKWTNALLAEHFQVPAGTMNGAWSRKLKPALRNIGDLIAEAALTNQ
ncbi:hypothetical protein [Geitlerinema sp. P-1104]|uniref:hypothetical protein n=1 Tax=Geitlerinema sp. P-1104 TaxID=2546230 RepID=UPI00257004A7|nr:hypothetical protein [Geitlerinema sp. P-1104]